MLIDVSMLIKEGSVFRRGIPPDEVRRHKFYHESEGAYESVMLSLSVHTATHVDLVFLENRIAPRRMIGAGKLLDITKAPTGESCRASGGN